MLAALSGAAPVARADTAPSVATGSSSEVALTSATLAGTVESSSPLEGCWFEWGVPPNFEASAPCRAGATEGAAQPVSAEAGGLQLGTTYGWRVTARNAAGVAHGETGSFRTLGYPAEEPAQATDQLSSEAGMAPPLVERPEAHGRFEGGLYVAYCPGREALAASAHTAMADHTGWPSVECLKMDKGSYGLAHTLVGLAGVHNFLLGGYGNDTVWAGPDGDVIWGDYQPSGQHTTERDRLHGGAGTDWIYSSHGHDEIWTGAGEDHVALDYGWGTVHCNGPGLKTLVMRLLRRNRHWRLIGCRHIQIVPHRA